MPLCARVKLWFVLRAERSAANPANWERRLCAANRERQLAAVREGKALVRTQSGAQWSDPRESGAQALRRESGAAACRRSRTEEAEEVEACGHRDREHVYCGKNNSDDSYNQHYRTIRQTLEHAYYT